MQEMSEWVQGATAKNSGKLTQEGQLFQNKNDRRDLHMKKT